MAQIAIREYDAKRMFASFLASSYRGYLVESTPDLDIFDSQESDPDMRWVIKPDQLFGKRGKYGLLGVKLSNADIRKWFDSHFQKTVTIGVQSGELSTFLIEPFVPHDAEYYISIQTERTHDVIHFSTAGGIEVEENWDQVKTLQVWLGDIETELTSDKIISTFGSLDEKVVIFIKKIYQFFREYGFAYLEVNPFTFDSNGNVVCLDMVARVDDTEGFKQKQHWKDLVFTNPFWVKKTEAEEYIAKLDSQTGASLKLRILNPQGRIWLLTSGGGASVIVADTLGNMGYTDEIGNYGECSGNPDRENTCAYAKTLISSMLANGKPHQYLIIAGAITNFTHIDKTFSGIIDAFTEYRDQMIAQDIRILVRRGGINDVIWLRHMKESCEKLGLPCEIADGNVYMTDILQKIAL